MDPNDPHPARGPERPFAFLVSTTPCARVLRDNLGSAAYSYAFVLDALAPVLERFGTWRLLDHAPSQLPHAAARATAEGRRPVHLALNPLQDVYVTPAVPTILFPFWEFPDLPARDFGHDTRQNWSRVAARADLILAACRFTADAFRRSGARAPVAVVPVPLDPRHFDLPDWDPRGRVTLSCRHEVWGDDRPADPAAATETLSVPDRLLWRLARGGFRRVYPRLDPKTVERLTRAKRRLLAMSGKSPAKLAYLAARAGYRRHVRPWLSDEAVERITELRVKALTLAGRPPGTVIDPRLPAGTLTLGGLVYTSIFNLGDLRKNYKDLLSAFLIAFRGRPDATLVLKLATSPHREFNEMSLLRKHYRGLGLSHRCRVVVITDYLDDGAMAALSRATTYYINTSHAEGACLPLQQALAGGRPAIAPDHTAMADYMDPSVGFVVRSHPEPTHWPHDPERRLETSRYRLVWSDLRDRLCESADVAGSDPARYAMLADAARRRMADHAGRPVAAAALRAALELLPEVEAGAVAWAS
jgi:glycosyltransferase involved in cell wall biosynthesis